MRETAWLPGQWTKERPLYYFTIMLRESVMPQARSDLETPSCQVQHVVRDFTRKEEDGLHVERSSPMSFLSTLIRGSLGFALISVAAFAVWAFGAAWFQDHGGELAMYAGCATVFVLLSGLLLHPLVIGPSRVKRLYLTFIPAFLAYAVAWCVAWFILRDRTGEWLGSAAGSLAFAAVLALVFKNARALLPAALVTFGLHSAGYFAGGWVYEHFMHSPTGRLLWGLIYGLGFGAGIGYGYWAMQKK